MTESSSICVHTNIYQNFEKSIMSLNLNRLLRYLHPLAMTSH